MIVFQWRELNVYKFKIFKLILVPKLASVCLTCLYFLVARNNDEPWLGDWDSDFTNVLQAYLITYSRVVYMMLLISYGDTPSVSVFTYCAELIGLTCGLAFYFFMLCTRIVALRCGNMFHLLNFSTNIANRQ